VEEIIAEIKGAQSEQELEVLFVDESHFSNEPYVQRGWFRVREKKKAPTPNHKERRTIFGALNLRTRRCYWKQADKGNSKAFIEFLHQLHRAFPEKWLIVILDNGSLHKSKKVKKFVEKVDWVKLKFLAPYSPEYNPIERFWKWLKSKVYGCKSFKTVAVVISKIRKFIWHYHEDWLVEKIHFNFQAYAEIL
jgi:transposase